MRQTVNDYSNKHFKRIRLLIFIVLSISYMYAPFSRMAPGIMGPELMDVFGLTSVQFGLLGLCFMWPYAFGQMPAGIFVDRYGSSKALGTLLLLTALGNILFGLAENFYILLISRMLIGLSVAGYFLVGTKIISAWYSRKEFTSIYGLFMGLGALGGVISTMPLQIMMNNFGWRIAMFVLGGVSIVLAFIVFFKVKDEPPQKIIYNKNTVKVEKNEEELSLKQQLLKVIKLPVIFNCAFVCLSISGSGHSLQSLWNGVYLADVFGFDKNLISVILLCAAVGLVLGAASTSILLKFLSKVKLIVFGEGIFLLAWYYMANNAADLSAIKLMFINFIFGFMQMLVITLCYTLVKEIAPQNLLASAMGLVNTFIWVLGVGCCQQIWGIIIENISEGIKPYSVHAFETAMWFQMAVLAFGFANAFYIAKRLSNKQTTPSA